jgi:protein-L-isoaspartate(D-aspartate) O-methyltransferase
MNQTQKMQNMLKARYNMIEGQVRPNKVTDSLLLDAMRNMPRELFVNDGQEAKAYADCDIDLGHGRILMAPMVLARLLDAANIKANDVVLEIGAATGYATALMSRLAATVIAVESHEPFIARGEALMAELECLNAVYLKADLAEGAPMQGPYNVILINGGVEEIKPSLLSQLADRGRLLAVKFSADKSFSAQHGKAVMIERFGDVLNEKVLFEASVTCLDAFKKPKVFSF